MPSPMSAAVPTLPAQVHVFVRDWLSSNNVLLKSRDGHVLIDSGYVRHAPLTLALLASPQGLGAASLARLINTHCHSDHMGGNAAIKARYGFVMPREIDARALPATRATLEMLAALDARVVIPGHGEPFADVGAALARAFARAAAFEADSMRVARHALKVVLTFALLDQRRLPLADMPAYMERVGIYRDFNARFFRLSPSELAERLVAELEKAHAARRENGWLVPA